MDRLQSHEKNYEECIFCRIVRNDLSSRKIYEDNHSIAILDINPLTEGHCLVIPKRHVQWFYDLSDNEICYLFKATKKVTLNLKKKLRTDVVSMIVRGLRIQHAHIILIPSSKEDIISKLFSLLDATQGYPPSNKESLDEKVDKLRSAVLSFSSKDLKDRLNANEDRLKKI